MPTLEINGRDVEVGDEFLKLSPEEQNKTVEEIAASMGSAPEQSAPVVTPQTEAPVGMDTNSVPPTAVAPDPTAAPVSQDAPIIPPDATTYQYKAPVEVPDFTPEEVRTANEPMTDLTGAPMKPAFGDAPPEEPLGMTTHTEYEDKTGNLDAVLKDVVDEKGDITTAAYNNLNFEQAMAVYNGILQHPDTKMMKNQVGVEIPVFRGHRVPFPEPGLFDPGTKIMHFDIGGSGPSAGTVGGAGLVDSATNFAQWVLSGADKMTGRSDSDALEFPEYKMGGIVDAITHDAAPMVAGGFGGLGLGTKVAEGIGAVTAPAINALNNAGRVGRTVGKTAEVVRDTAGGGVKMLGAEGGATAGLDEDTSGILSGEEPAIGKGLQQYVPILLDTDDPNMSNGEKTFNKKFNLMTDSFITGNVVGAIGRVFGKGLKVLNDAYIRDAGPVLSEAKRKQVVNDRFMHDLSGLPEGASKEERASAAERLNTALETGQADFDKLKDTKTGEAVELDPLAAIRRGAEINGDKDLAQRAETLRSNILNAQLPKSTVKQGEYETDVLDPFKEDIYQSRGGAQGVEDTRSSIVRSGQEEVGSSRAVAETADISEDKTRTDLVTRIENDPFVGETLERFRAGSNIDINRAANESTEALAKEGQKAEQFMYDKRNKAYAKLPDNVSVDRESWNDVIYDAVEEVGEEPKFIVGLTPKMKSTIESSGGRLKALHNDLVPQLTAEIARLSKTPAGQASEALSNLQDIKDNILRDQLDTLIEKGGAGREKFVDQLKATRAESQEYYDLFGKGAPLESIRNANKTRNLAAINPGVASENLRNTGETIRSNIATGPQNRTRTQALDRVIRDTGGDPAKLMDYYKAKVTDKLRATTQGEDGLLGIEPEQIRQAVQEDISNMGAIDADAVPQLQQFLEDVESGKVRITEAEANSARAADDLEATSTRVGNEQKPFYNATTGVENSEGQEVFEGLFTNKNDLSGLDSAIKRAEDQNTLSGLQAAFGRKLKSTPLTEVDIKDAENRTMKVAEKLFKNEPEVIDGIKQAYELERIIQQGKGNRTGPLSVAAEADKGYKATVNKVVTLFFGVLNPTATRVRNIAGVLAENTSPGDALKDTIDIMASNPKEFQAMIKNFNQKDMFSAHNKRLMSEFFGRVGVFDGVLTDKSRFDRAWEDAQTDGALEEEGPKPPEGAKAVEPSKTYKAGDALRPLSQDEYRQNDGGSYSTEVEVTVETPDGKFMNAPSLWMKGREGWVELDNDDDVAQMATDWEKRTGKKFPRFNSIAEAEKAAQARSKTGGIANGDLSQ